VYDRVAHLETAHGVWLKLCNIYKGSSEIKSSRRDTYNRQYQTFSQKRFRAQEDRSSSSLHGPVRELVLGKEK
jgi:hypothetical protein